jgi:hypothetical protein
VVPGSSKLTATHSILVSTINAFIEFPANTETPGKGDQVTLLRRIFKIRTDPAISSQQRIALLEHTTGEYIKQERAT